MYLKIEEYTNGKPILYGLNSMRAPYGVTMTNEEIQADADSKKSVPEGMFIVGVGDKIRFLPRARTTAAVTTASNVVSLGAPSQFFLPADILYFVAGYAEITFAGAVAASDTVGIKVGKNVYTVTSAGTSLATLAADFVTANAVELLAAEGVTVTQKGSSATLIFAGTDNLPLAHYTSNGATQVLINSTEAGYLGDHIIPLGTIASVGAPDVSGVRAITLLANAAYDVPSGCPVGVMVDKYLGIYPDPLDFTRTPREHVAPIVEADGVYEQNLPYCDGQLKRIFSDLRINKRFYRNV